MPCTPVVAMSPAQTLSLCAVNCVPPAASHCCGSPCLLQTEVARRQLAVLQGARSTTPKTPRDGRSVSGSASLRRWYDTIALQQGSSRSLTAMPPAGSSDASLRGCKDVAAIPPGGCSPVCGSKDVLAASPGAKSAANGQVFPGSADAEQPAGSSAAAPAGARPPGKSPGWQVLGRHPSLQQPHIAAMPSAESNVALKLDELEPQLGPDPVVSGRSYSLPFYPCARCRSTAMPLSQCLV